MSNPLKDYRQQRIRLQVTTYKRDTVIKFFDILTPGRSGSHIRGSISRFSERSKKRFSLLMRNTIDQFTSMVTLTYPEDYPIDISESKKHLNGFLQWLRRRKIKYIWTMEFQRRGAVHYHMVIDGWLHIKEISERWYKLCKTGDLKHLASGTLVEAIYDREKAISYMCSYMKKLAQKTAPEWIVNLGRYWGATRSLLQAMGEVVIKRVSVGEVHKALRIVRRYYNGRMKEWRHRKFKWKAWGFIAWGATGLFNRLTELGIINLKEATENDSRSNRYFLRSHRGSAQGQATYEAGGITAINTVGI